MLPELLKLRSPHADVDSSKSVRLWYGEKTEKKEEKGEN